MCLFSSFKDTNFVWGTDLSCILSQRNKKNIDPKYVSGNRDFKHQNSDFWEIISKKNPTYSTVFSQIYVTRYQRHISEGATLRPDCVAVFKIKKKKIFLAHKSEIVDYPKIQKEIQYINFENWQVPKAPFDLESYAHF